MRHQFLQLHHPTLHQPDRPGPRIAIPVLELEIDFLGTKLHKRQLHLRFPNADDENLPAELDAVNRRINAAFDTRALERDGRLHAAGQAHDFLRRLFGPNAPLHLERTHARHEFFRKRESSLINIRNDDRFRARSSSAKKGNETNRPSATNERRIAKFDARALDARESDGERFEKGAVFEAHGADLVAPDGRVVDVAPEEAVDGRGGEEAHVEAAVVAAREAGFALVADDVGFDGDAVAGLEVRDGRVRGEDYAGGFVAEDVGVCYDHGADAAGVPEVDV